MIIMGYETKIKNIFMLPTDKTKYGKLFSKCIQIKTALFIISS